MPLNYYPNDDPSQEPLVRWRGHAHLLFSNWINYYVYQNTPYDLDRIGSMCRLIYGQEEKDKSNN